MDCADIIFQSPYLNKYSLSSHSEVLLYHDYRLSKSFVCFGKLRGAKSFMSAAKNGNEEAQANCIHHIHPAK